MHKFFSAPMLVLVLMSTSVFAHSPSSNSDGHHKMSEQQYDWGKMGTANSVARDIVISMTDDMRFSPDRITLKTDETVRFFVKNNGKILHEFVLGTNSELEKHAKLMEKFPNMVHDEPYMAHVDPGKQSEIVWLFNRKGEFDFACLLPGHFQAGMKGKIVVQ